MDVPPTRHLPCELFLLAVLLVASVPFVLTTVYAPDEFLNLSHGARLVAGQVIYRDFFEFVTPLSRWIPGWTFAVTGPSVMAARIVQMAFLIVGSYQAYRLVRTLGVGPWTATLPGLMLILTFYRMDPGYSHHWIVIPFVLGTVQAALRGLDSGGRRWWVLAGLGLGLTFLTMQSDATILGAALFGWLLVLRLLGHGTWRMLGARLGWLTLGGALPLAAAVVYFLSQGALQAAWYHIWVWPLSHYKQAGGTNDVRYFTDIVDYVATNTRLWINMPFWYAKVYHVLFLLLLIPASALYALTWGIGQGWASLYQRRPLALEEARLGLVALMAIGFFLMLTRGRSDVHHASYYALPAALFATVLAHRWRAAMSAPEHVLVRQLPAAALVLFLATGVALQAVGMAYNQDAWLRLESPDQRIAQAPVFKFLRANTTADDRIIAVPFGGLYYFYGRPPASRSTLVLPPQWGYTNEDEYREVFREIEANKPKYVIAQGLWGRGVGLSTTMRYDMPGYRQLPQAFNAPSTTGGASTPVYIFERLDAR